MEEKFWKKNEKNRMLGFASLNFKDLLTKLRLHINTLSSIPQKQTQTTKGATTNVHESPPEVNRDESYARQVVKSPPSPHPERCHVCYGYHATVMCATLAKMAPDERVAKLMERDMCLSCIQHGHVVKRCPFPLSRCDICFKGHHTILHGRTYPDRPMPAPCMSANAEPSNPAVSQAAINTSNNANDNTNDYINNVIMTPTLEPVATTTTASLVPPQPAVGNPII